MRFAQEMVEQALIFPGFSAQRPSGPAASWWGKAVMLPSHARTHLPQSICCLENPPKAYNEAVEKTKKNNSMIANLEFFIQ